ncbi:hypothetical protein LPJ73_004154, partial [Coemansia sp. RSA 2703]
MEYTLHLLDIFESAMLSVVWEYQGENILKFLYKHHYVQSGALVVHDQRPNVTGDIDKDDVILPEIQQLRATRDLLVDNILEDLVPALLQALHGMPKKVELERLDEETIPTEQAGEEHILALSNQDEKYCDKSDPDIMPVLLQLTANLNSVNDRLLRIIGVLEDSVEGLGCCSVQTDERLSLLVDGLSSVKVKCEADKLLATRVMDSLAKLESVLSEPHVQHKVNVPLYMDASVATDSLENIHQSHNTSSELATRLATPANCEMAAGPKDDNTSIDIDTSDSGSSEIIKPQCLTCASDNRNHEAVSRIVIDGYISSSNISHNDQAPITGKIPSDATLRRVRYSESDRKHEKSESTASRPQSRRFSLRKEIRRHTWFG